MAWRIEFDPAAAKELRKLRPDTAKPILRFLQERIAPGFGWRHPGVQVVFDLHFEVAFKLRGEFAIPAVPAKKTAHSDHECAHGSQ